MARRSRRPGPLLRGGGLVAASLALAACVGPARTFGVYEAKAVVSVEQAASAVQTVHVGISQALADRNFAPYLAETMHDAEADVTTANGHFASIQPPDAESMRLRDEAISLLQRSSSAVESARIAVRAGDVGTLQQLNGSLPGLVSDLDRFVMEHR